MRKIHLLFVCIMILYGLVNHSYAQISKGGTPPSFNFGVKSETLSSDKIPVSDVRNRSISAITPISDDIDVIRVSKLDPASIVKQNAEDEKNGTPLKVGKSIPINLNLENSGTWKKLPDGRSIWRLKIQSDDAKALNICYDDFYLPPGAELYLYNESKTQVIGAFTSDNNHENKAFSTELIQGETVTLEYVQPKRVIEKARISITDLVYVYSDLNFLSRYDNTRATGWGSSQACEVNVNCSPVGDPYKDQKQGVVEIYFLNEGGWYLCTGSLVANSNLDDTPYFLTADHCGGSTATDLEISQWQFYFNFEAVGCTTPGVEPSYNTLVGATRRAVGSIDGGSDFLLLELSAVPPSSYNPYYNGWNRANVASLSGAGIHHPAGDIKKISTYTSILTSSSPDIGGSQMAGNSAWQVIWSANDNGWGVTEGGSSGSPIFDNNGRQVGTLSGGSSYCDAQTSPDYYGKFWYHWDQNGAADNVRLKPWLDPATSGATTVDGYDPYASLPPVTEFYGLPRTIFEGDVVNYTDLTNGNPTSWSWSFAGGTPNSSTDQNPANIVYNTAGTYDVSLSATNTNGTTPLIKTDYITVLDPTIANCDTIENFVGTPAVYTVPAPEGGYLSGNNGYGDLAKAEYFPEFVYNPYQTIESVRIFWGHTEGSTSNITFNVWNDVNGKPGNVVASKVIPISTIVTDFGGTGYTDVVFDSPVIIPGAFYIGAVLPQVAGDTIAFLTNSNGESLYNSFFEQASDGNWYDATNWGFTSLSNAIFPKVCTDPNLGPAADFIASTTNTFPYQAINFIDASYGSEATSWSWTFTGGTPGTSTDQNPINVFYSASGTYDVSLTVTNANGTDTETKVGYIAIGDPSIATCDSLSNVIGTPVIYTTSAGGTSYLSGCNEYGFTGLAEYFDSYDPYQEITGTWIHFADANDTQGATDITVTFYDGSTGSPTTVLGTATVAMTTIETDVAGGAATYVVLGTPITITDPFFVGFDIPTPTDYNKDVIAVYTSDADVNPESTGYFQMSGSWSDYNGGGFGQNFSNAIYPTVCTDPSADPIADFVASSTYVVVPSTGINFTDLSDGLPTLRSWSFSGATPSASTDINPAGIVYSTPGFYDVTLTVSNANGSDAITKSAYIEVVEPCDTGNVMYYAHPDYYVNATDAAGFNINFEDLDGQPASNSLGGGASDWKTYYEVVAPGDTNYFVGVASWFEGSTAQSNDWIELGPVTINNTGAEFKWSHIMPDNDFRDGYEVLISTTGMTPADFTAPAVYSVSDNDASTDGDQEWKVNAINLDAYVGQQIYIAFHHNATDMFTLYLDRFRVIDCTTSNPPVADFTSDVTSVCDGGTINFTDISTDAPISWSWNFTGGTPATSTAQNPTVTYNTPGTFAVELTATNAHGSNTKTVVGYVTVNDNPTVTITTSDVNCNGGNDGIATANPAGGAAPYGYSWSTGANTQTITVLPAGTYTVTVTDNNTCSGITTATINEPLSAVTANITASTNITCNGGNNGSATVAAGGGTPGYTYNWTSGGNAATETGLSAGTYTVTVTDINGCTATDIVTITQPTAVIANITAFANISCSGGNNGSATVTAGGGTPGYTYLWSSGGNTATETGLIAGTYTVTVTDVNGCTATDNVTITQPAIVTANITASTNATCNGGNNGSATVTAGGGTPGYTYLWSSGGTAATETGLTAGTYTVTVTDVNGCTATDNVIITQPTAVSANITASTNVTCSGGNNGSATVTAGGGTPGYTYLWTTGGTAATETGLISGSYTVTVTDVNGCTAIDNVVITQPTAVTANITASANVSCNGGNNGGATVVAGGGTPGYTYLWSSGGTAATETGLTAGAYTVIVTDINGCTANNNVTITQPTAVTANITASANTSCYGGNDGSATVTAGGGTPEYTYLWSSGGTAAIETGLSAGAYTVTVTDINGCTAVTNTIITEPILLTATITASTDVLCNGGNNGSATVTVNGGTPGYTYAWTTGGTGATETGLLAGTYIVTVTDVNGCAATASATITQPVVLASIITGFNASCNGTCDGSATINPTGGTAPYGYQWDDAAFQAAQTAVGLCAGTYNVTVTDGNGCVTTNNITITEPGAILLTTSVTDATCGNPDGSASVTVAGGSAPYNYLWSTGGTNSSISGVSSGSYSVTVTDANTCTATETANINDAGAPTATIIATTDVSCNGVCDGSATVSAAGGTVPYTYSWSTGGTGTVENLLCAGTHNVVVTDNLGCSASASATITEPALLNATITATTDASCNGDFDGSATVSASGGTLPYTYAWPSGGSNAIETGLAAGTYSLTVTDGNGCAVLATATITEPILLTATITATTNVTCNGNCDGYATVVAADGTAPYTYAWPSGGSGTTETGLCAGAYVATITDANGCIATATAAITEPTVLDISILSSADVSVAGGNDGSATAGATDGAGGYIYLWSNGTGGATATGLSVGTYYVTVTDVNGCTASASVVISEPGLFSVSIIASTDVPCNGLCDGTATAEVAGGVGPYTYVWSSGGTNATETGLCAGAYTVTATDASSATAIANVTIIEPTQLVATVTSTTDVTCFGDCDGEITLNVTGGTAAYQILWSNSDAQQNQTGLCAGTYNVEVTDAMGCIATASATVNEPAELIATVASVTDVNCFGGNDGSVTINVTGGSPIYTFDWSNGGSAATESGLVAGDYTVIVTDANGCQDIVNVTINEPTEMIGTLTVNDITCFGAFNGSATMNVTGGNAPYAWDWSPDGFTGDGTDTYSDLVTGGYDVIVTDANGCQIVETFTINEPTELAASITTYTDVICNGACNGAATVDVIGGSAPYSYNWDDMQTTQVATGLCAATYNVTVTDANGCTAMASVTISEPTALTLVLNATNATCENADGSIEALVSGGATPYSYLWDNTMDTDVITGLAVGTYALTVTDDNGCIISDAIDILELGAPVITVTPTSAEICAGESVVLIASGADTYVWTPATGLNTTTEATVIAEPTETTTYTVEGTTAGCTAVLDVEVVVNQAPVITVTPASAEICIGETVELVASGADTYVWTPVTGLSTTTEATVIAEPTATITYAVEGTLAGCTGAGSVEVIVNPLAVAGFDYTTTLLEVTLTDLSINAVDYAWDFGDGSTDNTAAPVYTYAVDGTYTITQTVTNSCNSDTHLQDVTVVGTSIDVNVVSESVNVYPNPNDGAFKLQIENNDQSDMVVRIINTAGKTVYVTNFSKQSKVVVEDIDISSFAKGIYNLQIITNNKVMNKQVVVK